jgi:hypothetical protein
MKNIFYLISILLLCNIAFAETPDLEYSITVKDDASDSTKQLYFGVDPIATDSIDVELGESELPPAPPGQVFLARLIGTDIGIDLGNGTLNDYRQGDATFEGTKPHEIWYELSENGTTITISWEFPENISGHLIDLFDGLVVDEQMVGNGSYTVENPSALPKLKMFITYTPIDTLNPDIHVQPTSWAFGDVDIGESTTHDFLISNTGNATLSGNLQLTGQDSAQFNISGEPTFFIAPDSSHTATVEFAPTVTGNHSAILRINSNDPDENPFDIPLSGTGLDTAGIDVYAPSDAEGSTGQSVTIPITIPNDDVTGEEIYGYDFKLHFSETVLDASTDGYSVSGTMSDGWSVAYNNTNDGYVVLSVYGTTPLSGSGTLINLMFDVVGSVGDTTSLIFSDYVFNDGTPIFVPHNGHFTVVPNRFDIQGNTTYFMGYENGGGALPDININMTGDTTTVVITDSIGNYSFDDVLQGNYTVTPSRSDYLEFPAISAYDASLTARASAELITLTAHQQLAADVSSSGTLEAFDASLIARFAVDLVQDFPAGAWKFDPIQRQYSPLDSDMVAQDYVGIGMGDVSGNGFSADRNSFGEITTPISELPPNSIVTIPLMISYEESQDIFGYQFDSSLENMEFISIEVEGTLSENCSIIYNDDVNYLQLVSYHTESLDGDGVLVNMICETGDADHFALSLDNILFNEADIQSSYFQFASTSSGGSGMTDVPKSYFLNQNYPNPFNPQTEISYGLPTASHVSIKIYDISGKLIKILYNGTQDAGFYTKTWDATNENGEILSSGLYFYVLETDNFVRTRKMVLLD